MDAGSPTGDPQSPNKATGDPQSPNRATASSTGDPQSPNKATCSPTGDPQSPNKATGSSDSDPDYPLTDAMQAAALEAAFAKFQETMLKRPFPNPPSNLPDLHESDSSDCDRSQEPSSFPRQPATLPPKFLRRIDFMGGPSEYIYLAFQKRLTNSDVSRRRNRFRMPASKFDGALLLWKEEQERARGQGMVVSILEPDASIGSITLGWCNVRGRPSYVLTGEWYDLVERHRLRMGMEVRLWSFRIRYKFWFALLVAEEPTRSNDEEGDAENRGGTSGTDQIQESLNAVCLFYRYISLLDD